MFPDRGTQPQTGAWWKPLRLCLTFWDRTILLPESISPFPDADLFVLEYSVCGSWWCVIPVLVQREPLTRPISRERLWCNCQLLHFSRRSHFSRTPSCQIKRAFVRRSLIDSYCPSRGEGEVQVKETTIHQYLGKLSSKYMNICLHVNVSWFKKQLIDTMMKLIGLKYSKVNV